MSVEYGADQIQILEGLEAVRKRPGMYIGSTSSRGLHHLVYEIVDNAVDEALAGFCDHIEVTINEDNSITVVDNGRGIPVGINHKAGIPAVEVVFTILHAGGKFGGGGYKVSGGLHGVGASVVNALSDWLEVEICQGGKVYKQRYERGHVCYPLKEIGTCDAEKTGTTVTFKPDATIFTETTVYEFDILKTRLREMAFLTKGLKISLTDLRGEEPHTRTFHYEGGIREFVTYLNGSKVPLYDKVMYFEGTKNNVYVEVALQHNDSYNESVFSFVNNINTPDRDVIVGNLCQMQDLGADIVKFAVTPRSERDVLRLLDATLAMKEDHNTTPVITMSMGKLGVISRICGEVFGSAVTFGTAGKASAPGQLPANQLSIYLKSLN